jgi:hypothetical protein
VIKPGRIGSAGVAPVVEEGGLHRIGSAGGDVLAAGGSCEFTSRSG